MVSCCTPPFFVAIIWPAWHQPRTQTSFLVTSASYPDLILACGTTRKSLDSRLVWYCWSVINTTVTFKNGHSNTGTRSVHVILQWIWRYWWLFTSLRPMRAWHILLSYTPTCPKQCDVPIQGLLNTSSLVQWVFYASQIITTAPAHAGFCCYGNHNMQLYLDIHWSQHRVEKNCNLKVTQRDIKKDSYYIILHL